MQKTNFPSGEDYIFNRSIMVVGAHADDNEIHMGGTLLKYHERGYDIVYVQSTNNMSGTYASLNDEGKVVSDNSKGPAEISALRKRECDDAAKMLGTTPIHLDHHQRHYNSPGAEKKKVKLAFGSPLPEGIDPAKPNILLAHEDAPSVKVLTDLILKTEPELIFTHSMAQVNIEHVGTSLLVTHAYWKAVDQGYKGGLLHWREAILNLGEYNTTWQTYVDYSSYLDQKMQLIYCHRCQKPDALNPEFGHRRLAKWWGAANGCLAAEVYNWVNRPSHRNAFGPVHGDLTLELINHTR